MMVGFKSNSYMASNHLVIMNGNEQAGDVLFKIITSVCSWKEYGIHVKPIYRP